MSEAPASKYGAPLTDSDWVGLPLRIGQIPEAGMIEDLCSNSDAILAWSGGPSDVTIDYLSVGSEQVERCEFKRVPGAIDLIPRGTRLVRIRWQGRPSVCVSVNLPLRSVQALSEESLGLNVQDGPRFGVTDAHVYDLIKRLESQADGREYLGAVYIQSLSLTLASYISAKYGAAPSSPPLPEPARLTPAQLQQVKDFIEEEMTANFSLVDLAALTGYGPDHFARLFKGALQQSPHQYVLARRIERAKAMLRDTTQTIAEIASTCGFASQAHLTTAFKQQTGTTPGAFRGPR
jgi:AraC family transcriptional regulator